MIADSLSGMSGTIVPALVNHLWQSTLLTAAVWLLTLALRKNRARIRYWLWLAGSIKFLIPFSLMVILGSHLTWMPHPSPLRAGSANTASYLAMEELSQPFTSEASQARAPELGVASMPARVADFLSTPPVPAIVLTIWLCGAIVILGRWTSRWLRIQEAVRRALPVLEGREVEALRRVEDRVGLQRKIELRLLPASVEPGIFGFFRPILLWPQGISERLGDEHLEAVLAHEVCHVRRRDNLTAAIHMLVEAICWFHPLVWWIETRLVEEREFSCDEEIALHCRQPQIYAESILTVCEFCVETPLTCVAGITGADLKRRIRSIMTPRVAELTLPRKIMLAVFVFTVIVVPMAFGVVRMIPLYGQILHVSGPKPSFAVSSVRPSGPDEEWPVQTVRPDGFEAKKETVKEVMIYAYGLDFARELSGGPKWIGTDQYDIQGKLDDAQVAAMSKLSPDDRDEQMRLRVQSLLAERFGLVVSFQSQSLPVYELVVAKGGLKCQKSTFDSPVAPSGRPRLGSGGFQMPPPLPPPAGSPAPPPPPEGAHSGEGVMDTWGWPFWLIAGQLAWQPELDGRPVLDRTGLEGRYDCKAKWSREGSNDSAPSFFTAIEEQMGLSLKPSKGEVETISVKRLERPSTN
ncbi:M56 family metallopeptidase [Granulicella sp. S156]|uniref:M56 family metallopeptidase n=1 Tax=Granulicella sp. S156 TaxID=1747224 RepID=UPI00131AC1CF|nr:M56 family metallopeptidase [Granulicella sp. S156]